MSKRAKGPVDYSTLTREELETRLRLAEDVVLMFGWSPARTGLQATEREKAAYMLWLRWVEVAGDDAEPSRNPHLNAATANVLARERDRRRTETQRQLDKVVVSE